MTSQQQFNTPHDQQQHATVGDFAVQMAIHTAFSFTRRAILSPLFRIAILMTTEGELVRQGRISPAGFGGILGCVTRIYCTEGPLAFWRGLLSDAALAVPSSIAEELGTDLVNNSLHGVIAGRADDMSQIGLLTVSLGATALLSQVTSVINDPIQTVMTCFMGDVAGPDDSETPQFQFPGAWAATKAIYRSNGVSGFFRGVALNAVSSITYRGSYYYMLHLFFTALPREVQVKYGMWIARVTSLLAGFVAQPVEVVRRRLMLTAGGQKGYTGVCDCVRTIVREEGMSGLWKGLKVRLLMTTAGFVVSLLTASGQVDE